MDARILSAVDGRPPESDPKPHLLFQRRRSRGRSRPRRTRLSFGPMLALVGLLAAFFFGLQRVSLLALGSKTLSLKSASISGATAKTEADILAILDSWRGISLIILDTAAVEDEIRNLSWVKEVRVSRRWPSKLDVAVRERTAMAVLEDGGFYLVDEDGVRLEEVDPAAAAPDLPRLRSEDGFGQDYDAKIRLARTCLAGLPRDRRKDLEVLEVGIPGRVGLRLRDNPVWIYVNPGEALASLDYFQQKVGGWQLRFGRLEYVDLTVSDRAFLGPGRRAEGNGSPRADSDKEVW